MEQEVFEQYTPQQALAHSVKWCAKRPAWVPIYWLDDTEQYYVQWDELSAKDKEHWETEYAFDEFATKRCKIETGFISGKGEFFSDVRAVPFAHNLMMVFRVGIKTAKEIREARKSKSAVSVNTSPTPETEISQPLKAENSF